MDELDFQVLLACQMSLSQSEQTSSTSTHGTLGESIAHPVRRSLTGTGGTNTTQESNASSSSCRCLNCRGYGGTRERIGLSNPLRSITHIWDEDEELGPIRLRRYDD